MGDSDTTITICNFEYQCNHVKGIVCAIYAHVTRERGEGGVKSYPEAKISCVNRSEKYFAACRKVYIFISFGVCALRGELQMI